MTAARRSMSGADAMWLHADRPTHLMVIDGLMTTAEPLDHDRFAAVLRERLVDRYPVFRQRPVDPTWPWELPAWEDDPDFALHRHVHRARLRRPGGDRQLQRFLERRVSRPLDPRHPLWEVWVVDGYGGPGGGSAVHYRLHHAMADGMALAQLLLELTDPSPDGRDAAPAVPRPPGGLLGAVRTSATTLARSALAAPALPLTAAKAVGVSRKLLLDTLPPSLLSRPPGIDKRLTWSAPRPLADVRAAGRRTGTTVNDVLVAALAGALARYLASFEEAVDHLTTMVPVNVRPPGEPLPRELGNRFALVLLHLPTGHLDPADRLAEVHRRMAAIKHSPEVLITSAVAEGIGRLHAVEQPLVDFFAGKAIGVTTNVVGPREPRWLAGTEVTGVLGWVPGSGRQSLGVAIFSYAGAVRIGFKVDAATVPEPERLVACFDRELDTLVALAAPGEEGAGGRG